MSGVLLFVVLDSPPLLFVVLFVAIAVANLRSASLLLRVDAAGIRLGRGFGYERGGTVARAVTVPWASVASLRLVRSVGEAEALELRLRPDAPLPDGVRAVIRDPARADVAAPELRLALPAGALDPAALRRAVDAFGAGAVPVHDAV